MKNAQKLLRENKIKPTFERLSILNYLENKSNHPTAGLIYIAMQKKIPTISKTTVYNTLKILKNMKLYILYLFLMVKLIMM